MKRLIEIQQVLKAPKNQYNDFWKYKYRSCEDILQAVKPLLAEYKLVLILEDEVVCIWERTYSRNTNDDKKWVKESINETWWRYYIKATAKLYDLEWKLIAQTSAYAREEEEKKWQDWSQISWSSSSYARKYCLSWMFLLDSNDGVDSDKTNTGSNDWTTYKESSKTDTQTKQEDDKQWFNKEQLDKFVPIADKYEDADAAIRLIRSKYKLSKTMEWEVRKLYESIKEIKWS